MERKSPDKKEIQEKIRDFFQSTKWKNFLTFLVFVALAFIFWVLQYFQQRFEAKVRIPLYYTEIPSDIVITNPLPESFEVFVSDKGTILLNYYFRKAPAPVEVNLENLPSEKNTYTIDQDVLYQYAQERLNSSSDIKSISPVKIEIDYSPLVKKELPVKLDGILLPAPGYVISDSLRILPDTIIVYGDPETLDTYKFISTIPYENKNINQDLDITLGLVTPRQLKLEKKEVRLTLQVEEYTEKTFEIDITCINLPKDRIVRFFPSKVDVHVQIGLSHYNEISASDFEIDLDYAQLLLNPSSSHHLVLSRFPSEILNYRIVPESVEFLMEQRN